MNNFSGMVWIETRKAIRSRMPLWTGIGSMFIPIGIAFLIFVARNPEISRKLGLVSTKADLVAFAGADWAAYLSMFGQLLFAGGFILFVLITSWVFGREFSDGTLKDMLAVPVSRASILLAKFLVTSIWSAVMGVIIFLFGMVMGAVIGLPGGSGPIFFQGSILAAVTLLLTITVIPPFAFFASAGRGYLLPIGVAIIALMLANLTAVIGWAEFYPFAIPGVYAQGKTAMGAVHYGLVIITGLAGFGATYLWWKYADQNK